MNETANVEKNEMEDSKATGWDLKKALRAERAGYFSEATKALVAVNSGGTVAVLTFMGTLTKSQPILEIFKLYGCWAFVAFAAGVLAALFVPLVLVDHVAAVRNQNGKSNKYITATAIAYAISIVGLISGSISIAAGLFTAF